MDANVATLSLVQSSRSESPLIPASALTIGQELKEYVITGIIGEGGFGIVYSALDTLLQRNVAIKEYMPAAIANRTATSHINLISKRHQQTFAAGMQGFIDEARLLAQFKHPALVEILRFWEANDTAYMVMPHYSGKTLRNILKRDRNIATEAWLKEILTPILDATDLLHNNNIYHRDIAPDNIVIQDNGHPVLLDLGSARRVIAGMQNALTVVVKPGYAPIEQYTEDTASEQGPWTDIYALGAVLYFALTGAAPAASVSRMMRDTLKLLSKEDFPSYSEDFLSAINCALHLRPNDRFKNISEFREALNFNTAFSESVTSQPLLKVTRTPQPLLVTSEDDEITQILSEIEVSLFREKLLNTLSYSARAPHRPIVDNEINENILIAPNKRSSESLSTFDDVKNLLEGKPAVGEGFKPSKQKSSELNTRKSTSTTTSEEKNATQVSKRTLNYIPLTLGALAITSIALTSIWLINSTDNKDIGADILMAETHTSPTNTGKQQQDIQQNLTEKPPTVNESGLNTIQENTSNSIISNLSNEFQQDLSNSADKLATDDFNTTTNSESVQIDAKGNVIGDSNDTHKPETITSRLNAKADIRESTVVDSGVAKITIIPWGEIWIDNQRYGVSPPVRELSLVVGSYRMELRNPGQPTEIRTINIKLGKNPAIYHNFSAVQKEKVDDTAASYANKTEHKNNKIQSDTTNKEITKNPQKQDMQNSEKINAVSPQQKVTITTERTLHIKVLPWGEIFVDGKIAGVTPPLHQIKLSPGEHIIEIRHPKYTTKIVHIGPADSLVDKLEHHFQ